MEKDAEEYLFNGTPSNHGSSIEKLQDPEEELPPSGRLHTNPDQESSQILPDYFGACISECTGARSGLLTKGTSRKDKNKSAAERYREKRKAYSKELEDSVSSLQAEIASCESELAKVKGSLVNQLNTSKSNNQHKETYDQMSSCITSEEPDLDKINLLLDTLKYRIGANGRERQAKIDYFFKQIVNTILPALHRYFMYCGRYKKDIFSLEDSASSPRGSIGWTAELYRTMKATPQQIQKINSQFSSKFKQIREETIFEVQELNRLKQELKDDEEVVENMIYQLRLSMNPVTSALWLLFAERHKYRREIRWDLDFEEGISHGRPEGRKRVKTEEG